jgi:hypothetical protein
MLDLEPMTEMRSVSPWRMHPRSCDEPPFHRGRKFGSSAIDIDFEAGGSRGMRGALAALRRLCAVVKDSFLAWTSCSIRDIHVLSIVRVRDGTGGPGGSNCHDQR